MFNGKLHLSMFCFLQKLVLTILGLQPKKKLGKYLVFLVASEVSYQLALYYSKFLFVPNYFYPFIEVGLHPVHCIHLYIYLIEPYHLESSILRPYVEPTHYGPRVIV